MRLVTTLHLEVLSHILISDLSQLSGDLVVMPTKAELEQLVEELQRKLDTAQQSRAAIEIAARAGWCNRG